MKNQVQIQNKKAYFETIVNNMNIDDFRRQIRIYDKECQLEKEMYEKIGDKFDVEEEMADATLIGWIELIENEALYKAVKSLSLEDQIFISYIFKEGKKQCEMSKIYNVSQKTISIKLSKIIGNIKKSCAKGRNLKFSKKKVEK